MVKDEWNIESCAKSYLFLFLIFRHIQGDYGVTLKASIIQFMKALVLATFGVLLVYAALTWLGMGRHGRTDWGFLHLDWILQTHLPYWGRHMRNLFWLILGIFFCFCSLRSLSHGIFVCREYASHKKGRDTE